MYQFANTATLAEKYDWIDHRDPAFDLEGSGFTTTGEDPEDQAEAKFYVALCEALECKDQARIKSWLKPGEQPTLWKLEHLSDDAMRYLSDAQQATGMINFSSRVCKEAARLALVGVVNLTGPDGKPFEIARTERHPVCGLHYVNEKPMRSLEKIDGGALLTRIGIQAMKARTPQGNS